MAGQEQHRSLGLERVVDDTQQVAGNTGELLSRLYPFGEGSQRWGDVVAAAEEEA